MPDDTTRRQAGGERARHREALETMVGQLIQQGLPADKARETAKATAIRHEINEDNNKR